MLNPAKIKKVALSKTMLGLLLEFYFLRKVLRPRDTPAIKMFAKIETNIQISSFSS